MLMSILEAVPSEVLPPEIVSDNGIVYVKSTLECSRYDLPFECIDDVCIDILDKENIGRYCPINDHENVVTLPFVTEKWRVEDKHTRWTITMYTLKEG